MEQAKTILDALEHRTLAAARSRQLQEKEQQVARVFEQAQAQAKARAQAQAKAQWEKSEMERRTGQEAAAKLLNAVQSTAGKAPEAKPTSADVTGALKQQAETKPTAESPKQPVQELSGTTTSESVAESHAERVRKDEAVTSASGNPNQKTEEKKAKKEKRSRGNKGKTKKMRKKTATGEL